jgi:hypothetical protein
LLGEKLEELYSKKNELFAAADEFELVEETVDAPKGTNFHVTRVKRMKEEKRSKETYLEEMQKKQYKTSSGAKKKGISQK